MKIAAGALLLFAVAAKANKANQDTAYYPGFSNPLVDEDEMYYRESINVLQDLAEGEFTALYIRYHGCVWSEYNGYGNDGDDEDRVDGCGGDGGDEYWYMGRTQCFRANVAFSLYGVKSGKTGTCKKANYINSFFTTGGIESFGDSVGVDYASAGAETSCYSEQVNDQQDDNNDDNNREHNKLIYTNYVSYGLGCSSSGDFVQAQFQGAYCDGNHFLKISQEVSDLNSELDELGCIQIYGGNEQVYNYGDNGGDDNYGSPAALLLSNSAVCSHVEYPKRCPDPHGIKAVRDNKLFNVARSHYRAVPRAMPIISALLLIGAFLLFHAGNQVSERAKKTVLGEKDGSDPTIYERLTMTFTRTATNVSQKVDSFKEKLIEYAEAEEDDIEPQEVQSYQPPDDVSASDKADEKSARSVANSNKSSNSAASQQKSEPEPQAESPMAMAGSAVASVAASVAASFQASVKSVGSGPQEVSSGNSVSGQVSVKSSGSAQQQSVKSAKSGEASVRSAVVPVETVDPPSVKQQDSSERGSVSNKEVANAMLAEKGIPAKPGSDKEKKKYKRPLLARITKSVFKRKTKKGQS